MNLYRPIGGAFGPDPTEARRAIEDDLFFATQTLFNVCVTLNEFPLIRYYNPSHPALGPLSAEGPSSGGHPGSARLGRLGSSSSSSAGEHFTKKLAIRLQQTLDDYRRDNETKPDVGRPRGILFITDRSMDPLAPLLHEFTYQAMANDLLAIEDGLKYHYKYQNADGKSEEKDAVLSDEDSVWVAIRHLHIAEAIDKLSRDFRHHAGEAGAFASEGSSLNDMRDMLASLPHMQEMKDKLSLHLTMAQDCMSRFEKTRLPSQAMVEQNCATRLTPEGQKPRTLVEEMVPLLDDRAVSNADKVRVIALYIMFCEGVNDEDRKRLFQHARLGLHEMDAVNNLVQLGVQVVKDPAQSSAWDGWLRNKGKRRQQPTNGENEYELSRYQPLVKLMVEDHFTGKLDQSTYPYVKDAPPELASSSPSYLPGALANTGRDSPLARVAGAAGLSSSPGSGASARPSGAPSSLRSAKPTWHQKPRGGGAGAGTGGGGGGMGSSHSSFETRSGSSSIRDETRQRVMVFVAGGMTYSEVRSIYQLSDKLHKDGYIGSSHTFTPESFINSLKQFGKASDTIGGAAGAQRSGGTNGHGQLPPNAISPPPSEGGGLMSKAQRAVRSNNNGDSRSSSPRIPAYPSSGSTNHSSPGPGHDSFGQSQSGGFDQGQYDRRFQTVSGSPSPYAGSGAYGGGQNPQGGSHPQPHGGPGDMHRSPATFSGATGASIAGHSLKSAASYSGSVGDVSLNSTGSGASGDKSKRKIKNVFGFKKG